MALLSGPWRRLQGVIAAVEIARRPNYASKRQRGQQVERMHLGCKQMTAGLRWASERSRGVVPIDVHHALWCSKVQATLPEIAIAEMKIEAQRST
jgi:hypothetical protein